MKCKVKYDCLMMVMMLLFSVRSGTAFAQPIPLIKYKMEQGLPSNIIYSVISDSKGYLWIGTNNGLCRYNGITFKTYTTLDGLPDNEVFSAKEDIDQRIWITTFKGNLCFLKDGIFHTAANTPWLKLPSQVGLIFSEIANQKDGSIILVCNNGKAFINIKGNTIRSYDISTLAPKEPSGAQITKLSPNLFRVYNNDQQLYLDSTLHLLSRKAFLHNGLSSHKDEVYLFNKSGIYDDKENLLIASQNLGYNAVVTHEKHSVFIFDKQLFWIGRVADLFLNNRSIFGGKSKPINDIEMDVSGNFWVSTRGDGLYKFSRHSDKVQTIPDAYSDQVVYARIFKDTLYFINNNGRIYSLAAGKTKVIVQIGEEREDVLDKGNLFITDHADAFQLSFTRGYYIVPGLNRTRTPVPRKFPFSFPIKQYVKEVFDVGEYLYVFSVSDIIKLRLEDLLRNKKADLSFVLNSRFDVSKRIYAKAKNPANNNIWFSRTDGVFKIEDSIPRLQKQLSQFNFRQFGFYGPYLVGITDNSKLIICNTTDKNLQWDSSRNDKCIWDHIYPIDRQHAIISTNDYYRMLTLYPASALGKPRYTIQAMEDPFVPLQAEYIVADSSNCFFFKDGKITRIPTGLLFERVKPPVPLFSLFKAANQTYPIKPEITIPYSQSGHISLTFDNISFASNDIICEYSISQGDKREEWVAITGNEINLNTPGFGDYTIRIRSKTISSGYSKPAVLKLTVLKPYWATWWFITICILLLVASVWGIVLLVTRRKLRKKHKEHEADMKYQQSEYKALNALMNPHFIFNSLNNIQGLINKDEKRIANDYLVIFADLIRQNMHNISKGFISLQQELNLVENYLNLEQLRFKDFIHYEIVVEEEVEAEDIMIPPLMIQPLVENAVKHGLLPKQSTDGMIRIHLYEKESLLYVTIEDNGIGLTRSLQSKNRLYESFGLANLTKRTEHLKKIQHQEISIEVLEIKNEEGGVKGTRAMIRMDLKVS